MAISGTENTCVHMFMNITYVLYIVVPIWSRQVLKINPRLIVLLLVLNFTM